MIEAPERVRSRSIEVASSVEAAGNARLDLAALLRNPNVWFALLVGMGVGARLFHFNHPIDDALEWRQAQALMYAASYGHGAAWLTPTDNWSGASLKPAVLEFPLYSILAFLAGNVVGLVTGARLVSLGAGITSIFLFDRLCARLGHPRRRTATVLFALTPIAIFYSHATQAEALLMVATLGAAYCYVRGREGDLTWILSSSVLLALAMAIKPTALFVLGPCLVWDAWQSKSWKKWGTYGAVGAVAVVISGAWYAYARSVLIAQAPDWYSLNTNPSWLFGPIQMRFNPYLYETLLQRMTLILAPPLTAGLLIVVAARRSGSAFWWLWLGGSVAAALVFTELTAVHFYYELLWAPALAALIAYAMPPWPSRVLLQAGGVALAAAAVAIGCHDIYQENPIYLDAGRALAASSPAQQPVLVLSARNPYFPVVLFYADRNGWNLLLTASPDDINALSSPGPCHLVAVLEGGSQWSPPAGWVEDGRTSEYVLAHRDAASCN